MKITKPFSASKKSTNIVPVSPEHSLKPLDWKTVMHEWESSGLPQREFCEKKSLAYTSFMYQRNRIKKSKSVLECIITQVSEELEYVPAKVQVIEHRCKKYICTACVNAKKTEPAIQVTSKIAEKPAQIIPKSFASPSLLAHIATAKFCDHLPLYRQECISSALASSYLDKP